MIKYKVGDVVRYAFNDNSIGDKTYVGEIIAIEEDPHILYHFERPNENDLKDFGDLFEDFCIDRLVDEDMAKKLRGKYIWWMEENEIIGLVGEHNTNEDRGGLKYL